MEWQLSDDTNERAISHWQSLLLGGLRITASGGSDTHNPPSMIGEPTTYVKARSLSPPPLSRVPNAAASKSL